MLSLFWASVLLLSVPISQGGPEQHFKSAVESLKHQLSYHAQVASHVEFNFNLSIAASQDLFAKITVHVGHLQSPSGFVNKQQTLSDMSEQFRTLASISSETESIFDRLGRSEIGRKFRKLVALYSNSRGQNRTHAHLLFSSAFEKYVRCPVDDKCYRLLPSRKDALSAECSNVESFLTAVVGEGKLCDEDTWAKRLSRIGMLAVNEETEMLIDAAISVETAIAAFVEVKLCKSLNCTSSTVEDDLVRNLFSTCLAGNRHRTTLSFDKSSQPPTLSMLTDESIVSASPNSARQPLRTTHVAISKSAEATTTEVTRPVSTTVPLIENTSTNQRKGTPRPDILSAIDSQFARVISNNGFQNRQPIDVVIANDDVAQRLHSREVTLRLSAAEALSMHAPALVAFHGRMLYSSAENRNHLKFPAGHAQEFFTTDKMVTTALQEVNKAAYDALDNADYSARELASVLRSLRAAPKALIVTATTPAVDSRDAAVSLFSINTRHLMRGTTGRMNESSASPISRFQRVQEMLSELCEVLSNTLSVSPELRSLAILRLQTNARFKVAVSNAAAAQAVQLAKRNASIEFTKAQLAKAIRETPDNWKALFCDAMVQLDFTRPSFEIVQNLSQSLVLMLKAYDTVPSGDKRGADVVEEVYELIRLNDSTYEIGHAEIANYAEAFADFVQNAVLKLRDYGAIESACLEFRALMRRGASAFLASISAYSNSSSYYELMRKILLDVDKAIANNAVLDKPQQTFGALRLAVGAARTLALTIAMKHSLVSLPRGVDKKLLIPTRYNKASHERFIAEVHGNVLQHVLQYQTWQAETVSSHATKLAQPFSATVARGSDEDTVLSLVLALRSTNFIVGYWQNWSSFFHTFATYANQLFDKLGLRYDAAALKECALTDSAILGIDGLNGFKIMAIAEAQALLIFLDQLIAQAEHYVELHKQLISPVYNDIVSPSNLALHARPTEHAVRALNETTKKATAKSIGAQAESEVIGGKLSKVKADTGKLNDETRVWLENAKAASVPTKG